MQEFGNLLLLAAALIFVIEGLLYALFPDVIRKMMAMAIMTDVQKLRLFGLGMTAFGVFLVWLLQEILLV